MDSKLPLADEVTIDYWHSYPASYISHHGQSCCDTARHWLITQDYNLDSVSGNGQLISAPRWIPERYEWGPSPWPLFWCEAVAMQRLDCGALAAFSREVYLSRGVRAAPVQLIQRLSCHAIGQLRKIWRDGPGYLNWLADDKIYHEAVAVSLDGIQIQIWDATNGWWIQPMQIDGYGAVLKVKVSPLQPDPQDILHWGNRMLVPGSWTEICAQ